MATLVSPLLGLAMIGEALYRQPGSTSGGVTETADRSYTLEELARYDSKDGNRCLVAVDGEVYTTEGFELWKDGEHLPSGGPVAG